MKTFWKFRMIIVIAALVLVAGGAIAVGAKGLVGGEGSRAATTGSSEQPQPKAAEPTQAPKAPEPAATKGTEPTAAPAPSIWTGKITSVDCAKGTITVALDNNAGTASANMSANVQTNVSGCGGLKVGWHVTIEAKQVNGQWVVVKIVQDDSGQPTNSGGGEGTPTPGASH